MTKRFYACKSCSNIVYMIRNSGIPMVCCGQAMEPAVINREEASRISHLPVAARSGDDITIAVGEVVHPMTEQHYIDWIGIETTKGVQCAACVNGPTATFPIGGDIPIAAYAFCNKHGLWRTEL